MVKSRRICAICSHKDMQHVTIVCLITGCAGEGAGLTCSGIARAQRVCAVVAQSPADGSRDAGGFCAEVKGEFNATESRRRRGFHAGARRQRETGAAFGCLFLAGRSVIQGVCVRLAGA